MSAIAPPKTVGEIDSFINMLLAACEDPTVYARLETLLSMPDGKRQAVVRAWVSDLLIAEAPRDFALAIACLSDDRIAERAYEAIYRCRADSTRSSGTSPIPARWRRGLVAAAALALGAFLAYCYWPEPRFYELQPGPTLISRGPVMQAYEDLWWADIRTAVARYCENLDPQASGAYSFALFINSAGGVRRAFSSPEDQLGSGLKQELASMHVRAFTPEQAAETSVLSIRGRLLVQGGRCRLQRNGWRSASQP